MLWQPFYRLSRIHQHSRLLWAAKPAKELSWRRPPGAFRTFWLALAVLMVLQPAPVAAQTAADPMTGQQRNKKAAGNNEASVKSAMAAFDQVHIEFVRTLNSTKFLESWAAIKISDTPADFQVAWGEARRAWENWIHAVQLKKTNLIESEDVTLRREANGKLDNLQIVAGQYVPEIRERVKWKQELMKRSQSQ